VIRLAALIAAGVLVGHPAAAADYQPLILPAAKIMSVVLQSDAVVVTDADDRRHQVVLDGGQVRLVDADAAVQPSRRPGMLDDGVIGTGGRNIRAAWLDRPTRRYGHGVIGDAVEAGGLTAELSDGRRVTLTLDDETVFEDRLARIADIDGDGADEILVVRSYLDRGATLTVVEATAGGLRIGAEAPPIGLSHRWLNPIAVADFDGDGRIEAALVETPHIGGILKLYERRGDRLVLDHRQGGFSNHFIGSRILAMAAVLDADGNGVPDIAVPDAARQAMRIVTFAGGRFAELARIGHQRRIVSAVVARDLDGDGKAEIIYALADGALVVLSAVH
jgi:hypothetical protein